MEGIDYLIDGLNSLGLFLKAVLAWPYWGWVFICAVSYAALIFIIDVVGLFFDKPPLDQ